MAHNLSAIVQIRLTARDKKRVEALAVLDQVTVSDFVRRLISTALGDAHGGEESSTERWPV